MILKSCRSLTMIFFLGMDVWMNNIELNSTISPGLIWPKPTATEARLVARLEASRQEMAETRDIVDVVVVGGGVLCSGAESGLRLRRENIGRYNGRVVALYRPLYTSWTTRDFWHSLEGCSKLGINVSSSQTIYNAQNSANPPRVRTKLPTHTFQADNSVRYVLKSSLGTLVKVLCCTCHKLLSIVKSLWEWVIDTENWLIST